jgi:hypothetical protein
LRFFIAIAVVLTTFALSASASATIFTISGDWKMGSFAVKRDGKLRGAVDAFGQPSSKVRNGEVCTVRWSQHGLRIGFYNLGGHNPCRGRYGFFSNARATGPHWKTNRGLAIGDSSDRLQNLYPKAKFHSSEPGFWPAGWWLVKRPNQFGTAGSYPGLLAHMHGGDVGAFHVRYAAGGD